MITGLDLFEDPDFHLFDASGCAIGGMESGESGKLKALGPFGRLLEALSPLRRPRARTYHIELGDRTAMTILPDADDPRDPCGAGDRFSAAVEIEYWPADTNSDFLLGALAILVAHHAPAGEDLSLDALWVAGNMVSIL